MNKQLICKGTGILDIRDGSIPQVTKNGVIVKVHYAGICHTDAHVLTEETLSRCLPRVLEKLVIGQEVVVHAWAGCRQCENCKADNHICPYEDEPQAHSYGVWKDGGFQEFMLVESSYSIVPVPDGIPLDIACMVPCSGITAYNAVENCKDSIKEAIRIKGKANVMFMGVGGLGLWATEIVKTQFGDSVTLCAVDLFEEKLEDATAAGADLTLQLSKQDDKKKVFEKLKSIFGDKVDAAIDFVCNSLTVESLSTVMNTGSTLALVGIQASTCPPIDLYRVIVRGIRIQGIYVGPKRHIAEVFDLVKKNKVKGPLIQHKTLEDVKPVLEKMVAGESFRGRAIVKVIS